MTTEKKEHQLIINANPQLDGEIPDRSEQMLAINAFNARQGSNDRIRYMDPKLHEQIQIVDGAIQELDMDLEAIVESVIENGREKLRQSISSCRRLTDMNLMPLSILERAEWTLADWNANTPVISTDWLAEDFERGPCCVKVTSASVNALLTVATGTNLAINRTPELVARIKNFSLRPTPTELLRMTMNPISQ